jgi:alginate O-acetyltransferase complex protein AlgI
MIFSSYEFLFIFLPLVLAIYYLLPGRARVLFLTLASYFFYGWWDFRFCGLMLFSTLIDYVAGKGISRAQTPAGRKTWMVVSVLSNLSLLGFFKYFDMFAASVNRLLAFVPHGSSLELPLLHLILPVGISFYTFQSMSYAIDLYRGHAKPTRSFLDFACYVSLYPQLVAGPIVRYHELAAQLVERKHTLAKAARGVAIFIVGLAKKVLIADGVASLTVLAFGEPSPDLGRAWVGALAYAMQIYFDFSGYSDMAIGLGLMLGFQFPINFNSPYQAVSITDFWRRWHISLSNWLRDYLYIPLGGNRRGARRTYINLALVMLLGGLWHGANWTFVLWGALHGALLAWEKYRGLPVPRLLAWGRARTFVLVCLAWVPFRATSLSQTLDVWSGMLGFNGLAWTGGWDGDLPLGFTLSLLAAAMLVAFHLPNSWQLLRMDDAEEEATFLGTSRARVLLLTAAAMLLFLVCAGVLVINSSSPFLYFQF